jgi:Ulp1 family protease
MTLVLCCAVDARTEAENAARKSFDDAVAEAAEAARVVAVYVSKQAHNRYSVHITTKDLWTLEPCAWINDIIMEIGSQLIVDEVLQNDLLRGACFVMSTFFSERLRKVHLTETVISVYRCCSMLTLIFPIVTYSCSRIARASTC